MIRNTSESLEEIKKTVVMEIEVNEIDEMGEGRPRDDGIQMAEDVERDIVDERRPWKASALHARWRTGVMSEFWRLKGGGGVGGGEFVEYCK